MRVRWTVWGAVGLGILLARGAVASPIVIDDFGASQSLTVAGGIGLATSEDGVIAADAIGGARHASLTRTSGYGTDALTIAAGAAQRLDLSSAAADTVTAVLTYDGGLDGALTPTGLGGVDLTSGDTNSLIRILARSDLPGLVRLTVYTDAGSSSTAVAILPGLGFGAVPFTALDVPFASFVAALGAGADFHSVGAITVALLGSDAPSLDAQLDSITATIPEPGTLPLLCAGIALLAALRRARASA